MYKYELGLIFSSLLSDSALKTAIKKIEDKIKSLGGTVDSTDDWGLRELSYQIRKQERGYYTFWYLSLAGIKVLDLKKSLNIDKSLLRSIIFRIENDYEPAVYSGEVPVIKKRDFNTEIITFVGNKDKKVENKEDKNEDKDENKKDSVPVAVKNNDNKEEGNDKKIAEVTVKNELIEKTVKVIKKTTKQAEKVAIEPKSLAEIDDAIDQA